MFKKDFIFLDLSKNIRIHLIFCRLILIEYWRDNSVHYNVNSREFLGRNAILNIFPKILEICFFLLTLNAHVCWKTEKAIGKKSYNSKQSCKRINLVKNEPIETSQ